MKFFLKNNRRGAILLEVLVAIVILAVGLISIIRSFSVSIKAEQQSRDYLTAVTLLENKLTQLLVNRYLDEDSLGEEDFEEPYEKFRARVTAEKLDTSDFLKKVTVMIQWGGKDSERTVEAATFLFTKPESGKAD